MRSLDVARRIVASRWHQLSDEQLLEIQFLSADPSALPNLRSEIPEGLGLPEVEFAYDTTLSTGRKVRCVHCKFDNHNRGFVLQFSDGSRVLVGGTCGLKRYGADFTRLERDFNAAQERASYLTRRKCALAAGPTFLAELDRLLGHEALQAYNKIKRESGKAMAPLARTLSGLDADGRLFMPSRVRDFAAETRRHDQWERRVQSRTFVELEQLKRSGKDQEPKGPIFKDLEEVFWVVQGLSFFRMSDDPGRNIQALASRARSALAVLEEAPGKTSDLKAFFRGMNDLLVALRLQLKRTAQPAAALSPSNMQKIVEWAQTHVHKSYSFDGLALSRRDGGNGEPIEYRLPMAIGSPDETFIDRFQEAMLAQSLLEPRAQPV